MYHTFLKDGIVIFSIIAVPTTVHALNNLGRVQIWCVRL